MKKIITLGLTALSMATFANANLQPVQVHKTLKPEISVNVFNVSGQERKLMKGTKLSRSKPRQVCISVNNVEILEQNLFVQFIVAPSEMMIHNKGVKSVKIESTSGGKEHLIILNLPKSDIENGVIAQCLRVDQKDPIGVYKVDVQFNDTIVEGLSFEVLK